MSYSNYKDKIEEIKQNPGMLFGLFYPYILVIILAIGIYYLANEANVAQQKVPPLIAQPVIIADLTFQQPKVIPPVDINQIKKLLINPLDRNYKKRFTIKVGMHLRIVETGNIECFYSENKATYAFTSDRKNYLMDLSLEQLEDELDPLKFFRVNRKFLVFSPLRPTYSE